MSKSETRVASCTLCAAKFPPATPHHCELEALQDAYERILGLVTTELTASGIMWRMRIRGALLRRMALLGFPGAQMRLDNIAPLVELARAADREFQEMNSR